MLKESMSITVIINQADDGWLNSINAFMKKTCKSLLIGILVSLFSSGFTTASDLEDNGDGTVTDFETGLIWQQGESSESDIAGGASTVEWENAILYCEDLELAGYTDWRLPNHKELRSLVDYERYNPTLDTTFFPTAGAYNYWTSTTCKTYDNDGYEVTANAWAVNFQTGQVDGSYKSISGVIPRARCVRGGL